MQEEFQGGAVGPLEMSIARHRRGHHCEVVGRSSQALHFSPGSRADLGGSSQTPGIQLITGDLGRYYSSRAGISGSDDHGQRPTAQGGLGGPRPSPPVDCHVTASPDE